MAICTACGAGVPEGARFCPACAAPVATPAAQERKLATMLFADLVGSTALASDRDAEHTRLLLDRFYGGMAAELRGVGGTLEKFAGDAVMAVFGVPTAYEDHAERALHAALSMQRRLQELFGEQLGLRIGVNTGEVILGRPHEGSSFVSGDAVNVTARLEQAAAPGEVLAGERTVAAAAGAFEFGEPRVVEAKGKAGGVRCRPLLRALSLMRPRGVGDFARAFVGRGHELAALRSTYRRVVELGSPQLVTVAGEAGVGKTRLVRELWEALALESPEPLRRVGRCRPYGSESAYAPIGEILKEHFGILDDDPPELVRSLLAGREILALTLGLDVTGDAHPLAVREQLRDAWVGLLRELVDERPAVLLVEDLHWADEALGGLLETVAHVRGPLLLIATTRPDGTPLAGAETVGLEPLAGNEADELMHAMLGSPLPTGLGAIVERAEGNPFFVEEILATLVDRGFLAHGDEGWELDAPRDFALPDSVHALIAARIDLLPPREKAALQAGAVVGRVFWSGATRALVEGEPDFDLLEERAFVIPRRPSSLAGEAEYAVRHALTREVAYGSIPKGRRARLHLGFAEWLERMGGGRDEHTATLAYHYGEALRSDYAELAWPDGEETPRLLRPKAVSLLRRAAELAVGRYEIEEGLRLLDRAIELAPDGETRAALWREVGRANALRFDGDAFWHAMERSLDADANRAGRAETYSLLAFETASRGAMWRRRPETDVLEGWIEGALELAEPKSKARARALLARAYWSPDRGEEPAREAFDLAEELDDLELRSFALGSLAAAAFEQRRFDESYAWIRRRLELLPGIGDPDRRGELFELAIPAVTAVGRLAEGRELVRQSEANARRLSPHHRVHAVAQSVDVEELAGDWAAIRDLTEAVEDRVEANLGTPCVRNARSLLLCALAWAHDGDEARARELEHAADELEMQGYGYALDPPRLRLALLRGDLRNAERLLKTRPVKTYTMGVGLTAARLDGLAAVGDRTRLEAEAEPLVRPGSYLEPFALRALGHVRADQSLIERAIARFEALGLDWHAEQTGRLVT
ncbi:MAG TPA: adenylate/guanylate cyclase domain-containing protein [Gaiellaceae bacterium]|nr:adenylate/guanylate cyclase domain-containing protein [Gaiellaceae bacterium]